MAKGLKPLYLPPPTNSNAECKVMPLILNAATPVTSSGFIALDSLMNLSVRIDQFNDVRFANTPWTTKEHRYGSTGLPSYNAMMAFLHQLQ